jgi:hypothetical protein
MYIALVLSGIYTTNHNFLCRGTWHKSCTGICQKTYALAIHAEKLEVMQLFSILMPYLLKGKFYFLDGA